MNLKPCPSKAHTPQKYEKGQGEFLPGLKKGGQRAGRTISHRVSGMGGAGKERLPSEDSLCVTICMSPPAL